MRSDQTFHELMKELEAALMDLQKSLNLSDEIVAMEEQETCEEKV